MSNKKVLVIGVDGGDFDVIRPLIKQGKLPNLAHIMQTGVSAELSSVVPPITAPAWISFLSGVNPGKHGIFDFPKLSHRQYNNEEKLVNFSDVQAQTLPAILTESSKKSIFLNVPITYPPPSLNGVIVSGLGAPPKSVITYPPEVYDRIINKFGGYKVDLDPEVNIIGMGDRVDKDAEGVLDKFYNEVTKNVNGVADERRKVALYLMQEYEWDFFMVVFSLTDRLQHTFGKFNCPEHMFYEGDSPYADIIPEAYIKVDGFIGELMAQAGDDTYIMVVSDHGFGPNNKRFYTNEWLRQKGLLKLKDNSNDRFQYELQWRPLHKGLQKLGLGAWGDRLPSSIRNVRLPVLRKPLKHWTDLVDWSQTKAYAAGLGININLKNREPEGIVDDNEYQKLIKHISHELHQLTDIGSDEKLADVVVTKEELYHGPHVKNAPDIQFSLKQISYVPRAGFSADGKYLGLHNLALGGHRFEGIFLLKGPHVKQNLELKKLRIIDMAPHILYLMGLPVLEDMDGQVVTEAIQPEYLCANPVQVKKGSSPPTPSGETKYRPLSSDEEEQYKEQLRALGYI